MISNSFQRYSVCLVLGLAMVVVSGCSSKPETFAVTGTVTLDGNPIQDGRIFLAPADGGHEIATGMVIDGNYEMECAPGEKTVRLAGFTADKKVIPSRYVMEPCELRIDVKEDVHHDFELTTKVKRRR
ncbi:hypothetical protein GC197_15470 [bacterium]|nr:hypothetical protein [bacterium]